MRRQILTRWDTLALGFMTLALFLGAGNIIYPPYVGKLTGSHFLIASGGFIVSGVELALVNKGSALRVCAPLGKFLGTILAASFYLFLGVFFAIPHTATVSYETGVKNFVPDNQTSLYFYTLIANFSLTRLIAFSVPSPSVIYPACSTLIVLSLLRVPEKAIALPVWASILFNFNDAVLVPYGPGLPFSDKISR